MCGAGADGEWGEANFAFRVSPPNGSHKKELMPRLGKEGEILNVVVCVAGRTAKTQVVSYF